MSIESATRRFGKWYARDSRLYDRIQANGITNLPAALGTSRRIRRIRQEIGLPVGFALKGKRLGKQLGALNSLTHLDEKRNAGFLPRVLGPAELACEMAVLMNIPETAAQIREELIVPLVYDVNGLPTDTGTQRAEESGARKDAGYWVVKVIKEHPAEAARLDEQDGIGSQWLFWNEKPSVVDSWTTTMSERARRLDTAITTILPLFPAIVVGVATYNGISQLPPDLTIPITGGMVGALAGSTLAAATAPEDNRKMAFGLLNSMGITLGAGIGCLINLIHKADSAPVAEAVSGGSSAIASGGLVWLIGHMLTKGLTRPFITTPDEIQTAADRVQRMIADVSKPDSRNSAISDMLPGVIGLRNQAWLTTHLNHCTLPTLTTVYGDRVLAHFQSSVPRGVARNILSVPTAEMQTSGAPTKVDQIVRGIIKDKSLSDVMLQTIGIETVRETEALRKKYPHLIASIPVNAADLAAYINARAPIVNEVKAARGKKRSIEAMRILCPLLDMCHGEPYILDDHGEKENTFMEETTLGARGRRGTHTGFTPHAQRTWWETHREQLRSNPFYNDFFRSLNTCPNPFMWEGIDGERSQMIGQPPLVRLIDQVMLFAQEGEDGVRGAIKHGSAVTLDLLFPEYGTPMTPKHMLLTMETLAAINTGIKGAAALEKLYGDMDPAGMTVLGPVLKKSVGNMEWFKRTLIQSAVNKLFEDPRAIIRNGENHKLLTTLLLFMSQEDPEMLATCAVPLIDKAYGASGQAATAGTKSIESTWAFQIVLDSLRKMPSTSDIQKAVSAVELHLATVAIDTIATFFDPTTSPRSDDGITVNDITEQQQLVTVPAPLLESTYLDQIAQTLSLQLSKVTENPHTFAVRRQQNAGIPITRARVNALIGLAQSMSIVMKRAPSPAAVQLSADIKLTLAALHDADNNASSNRITLS